MEERPNYYAIIPANVRYDTELKDKAKLLYGEISALSNKDGCCFATNKYFADLYGVSQTTISLLIKNLIDKGYIYSEIVYKEGTKEILNRYLKIIKDPYLKNLKYPIKENLKDNNTSNNNTSNNNKEIYKESFERLWKLYPNKKGKENAYKSFTKSMKDGVQLEEIESGIEKYITYIEAKGVKPEYIKHGSTWFNQKCWEDDYGIETSKEKLPDWFNQDLGKGGFEDDGEAF